MESEPLLPRKTPAKPSIWEGKDGALGWTVATAIMLINFITIGLGRMSGILYVDFMREYRVNRRLASAPFSVQQSTRNLFGPLVGLLGDRFGIRAVTVAGGLMGAGSAAACAFAKDITWITIFWGGVYGTGIAFTSTLGQVVLDDYFERDLSSASGLSFAGGSVGAMVFSFVLQTTIDDYGLENSYLIMGAVILLVVPLAITLTTPPWPKMQSASNEKGSFKCKTDVATNPQLTKSLSTNDIFSFEKGLAINKNLDKTKSMRLDPGFTALKISSQKDVGTTEYFDKKDEFGYGTFEKNISETTLRVGSNADQPLSQPSTSISKLKTFETSVDTENENIAKFMASIEELYSDSKARVGKSSQDSTKNEYSKNELLANVEDQDRVDSNIVKDSIDSNPITVSDDCKSVATVEVESPFVDSNYSKKEIVSEYNSKVSDEKVREKNRNLPSSNDLSYKLLYLKTDFKYNFPDLSFPKNARTTILNSSEIDSGKTLDEKQDDATPSIVQDDLQRVKNVESCESSDSESEKISSSNITDDKALKSDNNLSNKAEQYIKESLSSDQRTTASEKIILEKTISSKKKSSSMKRQTSTSLVLESPPQRRSSWKERSLPSKLPTSELGHSPSIKSTSSDDQSRDDCCLVSHPIRMILKLYLSPAFLVICLCRAVHLLTFMGVLTIIVDFSMDRGLLESDGKYAVTAMSLGDLIGRLCTGWVTDCMFIGLEKFMLIAMLLIGLISISLPIIPPSTILILVCVYSILQGSVFIRHPILVSKYTRLEERTVGMGFMTLFSGLLGFVMPVYIGYFRDGIGSYNQVFYINGAISIGIGLLWISEPCLKKFVR